MKAYEELKKRDGCRIIKRDFFFFLLSSSQFLLLCSGASGLALSSHRLHEASLKPCSVVAGGYP